MARIVGQTRLYRGQHVTLLSSDVELANGGIHPIEHVRIDDAACTVPVLPDGRVVMIRQLRPAVGHSLVEIPAGHLEAGEPPLEAARRELEEETGYRAREWSRIATFYPSCGKLSERMYMFRASGLEPGPQRTEANEEIEVLAVDRESALELVRTGEICDSKTLLAVALIFGDAQEVFAATPEDAPRPGVEPLPATAPDRTG